jgi:DNA primase
MNENLLDAISEKLDCKNYGHYLASVCPFHDDSRPSLMIYEDYYNCLSCGAHGTTKSLYKQVCSNTMLLLQTKSKPDYSNPWTRWLRDDGLSHVLKTSWQTLCSQPSLGNYLTSRKINPATQKRLGIGYREDWFTIPIRNEDHKIIGAVARANGETNTSKSRYVIPHEQNTELLYAPDWEKVLDQPVIYLVFGILDAVSLDILGHAAISTTGGKHLNPEALNSLRKRIVIIPDFGEESEAQYLAKELGWRGNVMKVDYPDDCKDVNDLLVKDRLDLLEIK